MYFKKRLGTLHEKGKVFAWIALTMALGNAAFWTIFPLVVEDIIQSEVMVGIFFTVISLIILVVSLLSSVVLRRVSRVYLTKLSFLCCAGLLFLFIFANAIMDLYYIEVLRSLFALFAGITLSLYVRDYASKGTLGKAEGRYYLYANVGWLIGPLIGGVLGQYVSRDAVFIFSSILYVVSFVIFHFRQRKEGDLIKHVRETATLKEIIARNLRDYFKQKALWKVFAIGLGLSFWWAIHCIYIPLYIMEQGFGDVTVGIVLAGSIIPLILLEKKIGSLADKHGLRKYLTIGFLIIGAGTILFQVVPVVTIILFLMAAVNVGAAFVEPLQETYLFSVVKRKDEERFYGIFNMSDPVANVIAPLVAAGFFFLWGYPGLWFGVAGVMLMFMLISLTVKR
ncbi:MFS transporter [Candidatus Woesearchaeota archaeon]|nr:MFS transporter [Candidatus Woesearchaeota archaeon]MBW3014705.1 MFS transporter [Candidatus Woesearchaeota archaeon]